MWDHWRDWGTEWLVPDFRFPRNRSWRIALSSYWPPLPRKQSRNCPRVYHGRPCYVWLNQLDDRFRRQFRYEGVRPQRKWGVSGRGQSSSCCRWQKYPSESSPVDRFGSKDLLPSLRIRRDWVAISYHWYLGNLLRIPWDRYRWGFRSH